MWLQAQPNISFCVWLLPMASLYYMASPANPYPQKESATIAHNKLGPGRGLTFLLRDTGELQEWDYPSAKGHQQTPSQGIVFPNSGPRRTRPGLGSLPSLYQMKYSWVCGAEIILKRALKLIPDRLCVCGQSAEI